LLYFILILNLCDSPSNICWLYNLWSNIRSGVAHLVIYEGFLMARYIFNDFIWPYARFLEFELSVEQTTKYKYNRRLEQKKKKISWHVSKYLNTVYIKCHHGFFFTKIKWLLLVDLNEVQSLKRTFDITVCFIPNVDPITVVGYTNHWTFNLVVERINLKNYISRYII